MSLHVMFGKSRIVLRCTLRAIDTSYGSMALNHDANKASRSQQALFRFSRFSQAYRGRLLSGLQDLESFCLRIHRVRLREVVKNQKFADRLLSEYVMSRHQSGKASQRSLVKHALLGCQHLSPKLKGHLTCAWENMRTWEEQASTRLRPPLPVPLWVMLVGLARGHGWVSSNADTRHEWFIFALLLEVGLLCLLRPGEICKLRHTDFAMPGELSMGSGQAAVRVTSPKNRRQFGGQQFVSLSHPNVIAWLNLLLVEGKDDKVWTRRPAHFSKLFRQLISELKLEGCKFTPGSLRPGGATMFFNEGTPIPTLRFLGRWTVEKSLEHYIQQAVATQILNRIPLQILKRLLRIFPACVKVIWHSTCVASWPPLPKKLVSGKPAVDWALRYAQFGRKTWQDTSSWGNPSGDSLRSCQ